MAKKELTEEQKQARREYNRFASRARNYARVTGTKIDTRSLYAEYKKEISQGLPTTRLMRNVLSTSATHAHFKGEKIHETRSVVSRATNQISIDFKEARNQSVFVNKTLTTMENGEISPSEALQRLRRWSQTYHRTKVNDRREFYAQNDF